MLVLDFRKTITSSRFLLSGKKSVSQAHTVYRLCVTFLLHDTQLYCFSLRESLRSSLLYPVLTQGWRDAPCLGELASLAEDPGLAPNTHVRQLATADVSSWGKSEPSSSHAGHFYTYGTSTHTHAYTSTHKTKSANKIFKSLSPWWKAEGPPFFSFIPVCLTWAYVGGGTLHGYPDWV